MKKKFPHRLEFFLWNKQQILDVLAQADVSRLVMVYHGKNGGGEVDEYHFYDSAGSLLKSPPAVLSGADIMVHRRARAKLVPWPFGLVVYEFVYDWLDYKLADWVYGSRGTIEFNVTNEVVRYLQMKRTGAPRLGEL